MGTPGTASGGPVDSSALLAVSPDPVVGFDRGARVVYANDAAARFLSLPIDDLIGLTATELAVMGLLDLELARRLIDTASMPERTPTTSCQYALPDGRWFECHVTPGRDGAVAAALFARDVTERFEVESALRDRARLDPLTGLLNHAAFHDEVATALLPHAERPVDAGLVLVDLDYLKLLNDVHGHHVGDQAIRVVADAIRHETRAGDLVGRLGGDEFGCLVLGCDRASTIRIAERLLARICDTVVPGAGRLSASAGVAFVASTHEPGDLFDRADRALYDAKANGRGVVAVATDTDIAYESRRLDLPGRTDEPPPDLSATSSRTEAARAALREWVHVLAASGGCVDLLDADGESVRACTYFRFGHDDWQLADETYRLDDYPNTKRAIERRETYTCRVDDPDADPAEVALLRERGFASLLLTPLVADGRPIGIIELFDTRHRTFTTDEQRVALALSSHLTALLAHLP